MKQEAYDLLQATIHQGIDALSAYFLRAVRKDVHLVESGGVEFYPAHAMPADDTYRELLARIPIFADDQYFYIEQKQMLVLKVSVTDEKAKLYAFIPKVRKPEIPAIMKAMEPARMTLAYLLRSQLRVGRDVDARTDAFFASVFSGDQKQIVEILEKSGIDLNPKLNYGVMLVDLGKDLPPDTGVDFRASLIQLARKHEEAKLYPILWRGRYLAILSGFYPDESRPDTWPGAELIHEWQMSFSKGHKLTVSIGVGDSHPIQEIAKSYQEARIVLAFGMTKGERGFIKWYRNLGILNSVFSKGVENAARFYRETLGNLVRYDREGDADLLMTLRVLLETNFNFKQSSEKLFVHINTVRYRYERIAQLLDTDLESPDTRFNLYAAVRIGEILKELDALPSGYIGDVKGASDTMLG